MTWIRTRTGKRFDPFDLDNADINIQDIGHSLSNLCRYNGHCAEFYSVAQHSVYVADYVKMLGLDPIWQLAALLHDGSEAYLSDVPRPLKMSKHFVFYRELEQAVQERVHSRFLGLRLLPEVAEEAIGLADMAVLAAEARDLMDNPTDWQLSVKPWTEKIVPLHPGGARSMFFERFQELSVGLPVRGVL